MRFGFAAMMGVMLLSGVAAPALAQRSAATVSVRTAAPAVPVSTPAVSARNSGAILVAGDNPSGRGPRGTVPPTVPNPSNPPPPRNPSAPPPPPPLLPALPPTSPG